MARRRTSVVRRRRFSFRRSGYRAKPKMTIPLSIVAGFVPVVVGVWNRRSSGQAVSDYLQSSFTGIGSDGKFNFANLKGGLMPIIAGFAVHKVASVIGINKALGRARVPLLRV